jgi:hypothetical protein
MGVDHEEMDRVGTDIEHTEAHQPRLLPRRDVLVTEPVTNINKPARLRGGAVRLSQPSNL